MKCCRCEEEKPGKFKWLGDDRYACADCLGIDKGWKKSQYGNPADPTKGIIREPGR